MKSSLLFLSFILLLVANDLYSQCGTSNISIGKTATASSEMDQFSGPSYAIDGQSTNWKSNAPGAQWIAVNLGQTFTICRIKISTPQDYYYPTTLTVYVSNSAALGTGTSVYSSTTTPAGLDLTGLSASGQYVRLEMSVPAASWAGHYEIGEIEIYNQTGNAPPTTSITSPTANQNFTTGSNITINANAADADGSVTKVEFFEGANKLGEDLTAPYSFTWSNVAAGNYNLTSKATDNNNATTTSSVVPISVTAPSGGTAWSVTGNDLIDPAQHFLGTKNNAHLIIKSFNQERMRILADGKVVIKTASAPAADADFAVNGTIYAKKLKITQLGWADFVFDSTYKLRALSEVESYIQTYKHLPDVPSASDVEKNGLSVGDQEAILLRKIEELTLYLIEQNKKIEEQQKKSLEQEEEIKKLKLEIAKKKTSKK